MNTYTFHVSGTHCASCKILIEDILHAQPSVHTARVDLQKETVYLETDGAEDPTRLADALTEKIASHGYRLSVDKAATNPSRDTAIWTALPIGVGLLLLFFMLQKTGILNFGLGGAPTPTTSFLIGLIASVSSCLAIVGGLVLSLSAQLSEDTVSDTRTFTLFHLGRLLSFALLGGILGALGGALGINSTFSTLLGITASLIMLFLGLHLVGIFQHNRFTLPPSVFQFFRRIEHTTYAPLLLGSATFFLPCGFTQSMQVAALGSGSFVSGSLIMFMFALGTFPVLALLSFGSATIAHGRYAPVFFKTAGIVVIGFGLFALLSGLAALGIMQPLFNI